MDESGSKGAQNELYSSVWAAQLDWDHVWKTMVLTRFGAICGPKWPIFKALSALRGAKIAHNGHKMDSFHLFVQAK